MRVRSSLVICVALACLIGCPFGTPRDHYRPHGHQNTTIAISPSDDVILFNAAGTGGSDLYLLRLANLEAVRIADTPEYEVAPSFSPDGQRIVYGAGIPGNRADHIFIMASDGSSRKQLTSADANDTVPRFSPDGNSIVFARDKTYNWGGLAANWEEGGVICVIGADGSGERQLTLDDEIAYAPYFAQDGQSVFFLTVNGLFSVPLDGSERPTKIGPFVFFASFSPDQEQLVYAEGKYSPDHELFIAKLDGTNKRQITNSRHGCFHPIFTNSGDRVYFLMEEWTQGLSDVPKSSIWIVKADGTEQVQITDLSLFDGPLNWKTSQSP